MQKDRININFGKQSIKYMVIYCRPGNSPGLPKNEVFFLTGSKIPVQNYLKPNSKLFAYVDSHNIQC